MKVAINCPHCLKRAFLRRTNLMSELIREKTYRCSNDECGHVFISVEEIQRTVVPPRSPRAGINLPLAKVAGHLAEGKR